MLLVGAFVAVVAVVVDDGTVDDVVPPAAALICFGMDLACFSVSANPTQFVPANVLLQTRVAVGVVQVPVVALAELIKLPLSPAQTLLSVSELTFCFHTWESDTPCTLSTTPFAPRTVSVGTNERLMVFTPEHFGCPLGGVLKQITVLPPGRSQMAEVLLPVPTWEYVPPP